MFTPISARPVINELPPCVMIRPNTGMACHGTAAPAIDCWLPIIITAWARHFHRWLLWRNLRRLGTLCLCRKLQFFRCFAHRPDTLLVKLCATRVHLFAMNYVSVCVCVAGGVYLLGTNDFCGRGSRSHRLQSRRTLVASPSLLYSHEIQQHNQL